MLRLKTFGALAIVRDGEVAEDVRIQRRQLSLLVVLAADGGGVTRDRLLGLFWPDRDNDRARHLLDQALYAARRALGADVVLEVQSTLQLNPSVLVSDLAEFRQAIERGDLDAAVAAYGGPFLDAVYLDGVPDFEQWVNARRASFAKEFVAARLKLAAAANAAGDHAAAVTHLRRAAESDPLSGQVVRALMTSLCYAGDQSGALVAYRVHATLVREELDVEPDAQMLALVEAIRAGTVVPPVSAPPTHSRTFPPVARPADYPQAPPADAPVDDGPSVAVLPFVSISTEAGDDYFSDGMTDAIINALSRLDGLRVSARTSVFAFKGKAVEIAELGRRLGVRTVVEGTIIRAGDRLRVAAKLIMVADGKHSWLGQFDRALGDVFAMHDEIAQAIAQTLKVSLLGKGTAPRPAVTTAAYECFLRGRHFREKRSPLSLRRALRYYREALSHAPEYALAHGAEADTFAVALAYGTVSPEHAIPRIRDAAARAIALDPTIAEPHAALGAVAAMCDRDWPGAEALFQRALALNPQYDARTCSYANYCLTPRGRFEDAITALNRARRVDPLSPVIRCSIGLTHFYARRFDEAARHFRDALDLDPHFLLASYFLGRVDSQRGHFVAAIEALERAVALSGGSPVARSALGYAHARAGDEGEALAILAPLEAPDGDEFVSPFEPAFIDLGLGHDDAAIAGFERAAEQKSPFAIWLGVQPEVDALRPNARFDGSRPRAWGCPASVPLLAVDHSVADPGDRIGADPDPAGDRDGGVRDVRRPAGGRRVGHGRGHRRARHEIHRRQRRRIRLVLGVVALLRRFHIVQIGGHRRHIRFVLRGAELEDRDRGQQADDQHDGQQFQAG